MSTRPSTGNIDQGHIVYYRANKHDCSACSLKPRCTTAAMRKVTRDVDEEVRDRIRALANTEAFQQSRRDAVLLTATAQNLRRLAKLLCRSPPPVAAVCFA